MSDITKQEELLQFFTGLLQETFTIKYQGRSFIFRKRFASAVLLKINNLSQTQQMNYLIAHLSVNPKLPVEVVAKSLPGDFLGLIAKEIKKYSADILSGEEPRTSPMPNPSSLESPKD